MSNLNHTQKLERELATERKACEAFAELKRELEAENKALREAAQNYSRQVGHGEWCNAVLRFNAMCSCGHDELAALLKEVEDE